VKAIRYQRYGSPDVLEVAEVDRPAVPDDGVLIRVRTASVNPLDFHFVRGKPYVMRAMAGVSRPRNERLGADLAGQVQAVGRSVTRFQPGDEVFGARDPLQRGQGGTFAEYVTVPQAGCLVAKPPGLTFAQAAAVPVAALTALQALRDKGRLRPGQKVLVNGAGGGVGTFTVQLAKALGAEVTGVCGTGKVDLVTSIGADRVVDYTRDDFTRTAERYDLMVDMVGNRTFADCRRVLAPKGALVAVGGPDTNDWIGPMVRGARMIAVTPFISQRLVPVLARVTRDDLAILAGYLEAGKVVPVLDRTYPLSEVPEAIRYLAEGHATGKVVIIV
jgi:NADPH:quinone reductase-like Zn-dependent oxidoreductase